MILSIIILAVLGGVAYFHYAQGFFSATLSTICAVVAAVIAVGYHEVAVFSLLQGAAADYAHALCLGAIFGGVYIVLRVMFDQAVPGNIRLPVMVDRVGGAAMGVIAGIFTAGVVALAAQMLPFGPEIGGHERYALEDRPEMSVPPSATSRGRYRNVDIIGQMTDDHFEPEKRSKLIVPVDDMLLSVVDALSTGSMAARQPFSEIHPDYPTELFGQRAGIQVGAKRTAMNLPGKTPQVTLAEPGLFRIDDDLGKTAIDSELPELHQRKMTYTRNPNHLQLAVRLVFNKDASDADTLVRLSPGSVRLVADGKNYWPIGTLEGGRLYLNKADDFLFVSTREQDGAIDFLFVIEEPSNVVTGGVKDPVQTIKPGVFIEAKRLARIDLSEMELTAGIKPTQQLAVVRKPDILKAIKKADAPPMATEFVFARLGFEERLVSAVNVGTPNAEVKDATLPSGKVSLIDRKISKLQIDPVESLTVLAQGENAINALHVPPGRKLVQVQGTAGEGDRWAWAELSKWELIDAKGKAHRAAGGWARVVDGNAERLVAMYNSQGPAEDITSTEGEPHDLSVVFIVPPGTMIERIAFNKKTVTEPDQLVP